MPIAQILTLAVLPLHTWSDEPSILTQEAQESGLVLSTIDREKPLYFKKSKEAVSDARGMFSLVKLGDEFHVLREEKSELATFELSEVLERVNLRRKIDGIQVLSSQNSVTVVVKRPLVLSASFGFKKRVTIYNYSKLLVVCPWCENVTIVQGRARVQKLKPLTRYYSFNCPLVQSKEGRVYLYKLESSWRENCRHKFRGIPSNLPDYEWLPQVLVTARLKHVSHDRVRESFKLFYPSL